MLRSRADIPVLWFRWLALVIGTVGYLVTAGGRPLSLPAVAVLGVVVLYVLALSALALARRRHPWPWYVTAALDLLGGSALVVLTGGAESPFLVYYLTPVLILALRGSLQWAVGGTLGIGAIYPLLVAASVLVQYGQDWSTVLGNTAFLTRFLVSEGVIFLLALLVVLLIGPVLRWREQEGELAHYERLFSLSGTQRPGVMAVVTEEVLRSLEADVALLFLYDRAQERLEIQIPDPYPMTMLSLAALRRIEWDQEFLKRLLLVDSPAVLVDYSFSRFAVPEAVWGLFLRQPFLVAPLVLEGEIIGLLLVGRRTTREPFQARALSRMAEVASRVARVVGWTESLYDLQRRYAEMSALNQVLREINSPRRLEEVLLRIVQCARQLLQVDRASVMLLDDSRQRLRVRALDGVPFARPISNGVALGEGIAGQVAQNGLPLLIKGAEVARFRSDGEREVQQALCLPLRAEDQPIGVLNLSLLSATDRQLNQEDIRLAQLLADVAAVAIAKAELMESVLERTRDLSHANRELATERHKLAQVISGIAEGIIVLDADDHLILWNQAALRLLGLPEEELRGLDLGAYARQAGLEELRKLLLRLHREAQSLPGPLIYRGPLRREDDRVFELWVNPVSPKETGGTAYEGAVAILRDVTLAVEEERMRSEFISTMAQDIRTPLTAIKGYVELVASGQAGPLTPQQSDFLARTRENIDRGVQLLSSFLDLSRIQVGRLSLYFEPVNVAQVVREVIDAFQSTAATRQIELRTTLPAEFAPLMASRTGLRQVLVNLLDNAFKYTSTNGQVLVRVEDEGPHLKFSVQDTGVGIPPEQRSKVFQRYGEGGRGVGLGLYIAKQVVEAHGGTIGFESQPGKGTVVFFTLPKGRTQGA